MNQSFLEFCKSTRGYQFYNKTTNQQIYKYELYWSGYTLNKCWDKFDIISI